MKEEALQSPTQFLSVSHSTLSPTWPFVSGSTASASGLQGPEQREEHISRTCWRLESGFSSGGPFIHSPYQAPARPQPYPPAWLKREK